MRWGWRSCCKQGCIWKIWYPNVRYTYTFNKPIYNNVRESYPLLQTIPYDEAYNGGNKTVYNRVFDCALNHYNIIKSAYKRNVNNLLVFEDDINFVVNKTVLDKLLIVYLKIMVL